MKALGTIMNADSISCYWSMAPSNQNVVVGMWSQTNGCLELFSKSTCYL